MILSMSDFLSKVPLFLVTCFKIGLKYLLRADEMDQWAKMLAVKPSGLSCILETHMVKGEN